MATKLYRIDLNDRSTFTITSGTPQSAVKYAAASGKFPTSAVRAVTEIYTDECGMCRGTGELYDRADDAYHVCYACDGLTVVTSEVERFHLSDVL